MKMVFLEIFVFIDTPDGYVARATKYDILLLNITEFTSSNKYYCPTVEQRYSCGVPSGIFNQSALESIIKIAMFRFVSDCVSAKTFQCIEEKYYG